VGKEIAEQLRRECPDVPVSLEGRSEIRDNPVVEAMLALVQFAAHPGDMFAWRLIQMSPLNRAIERDSLTRDSLAPQLLAEIQSQGFRRFIRHWGAVLDKESPLDDFGRARLADLATAAAGFDRNSSRDCGEFLVYVADYSLRDEAGGGVRVMTVYQAKGLGFDVVILPDLMDRNMAKPSRGDGMIVGRGTKSEEPEWVLCPPRKDVAECDAVLAARFQEEANRACYEQLCVLYVAMTRAKRALYMVTRFPGENSTTFTPAALLKRQLCGTVKPPTGEIRDAGGLDVECLFEVGDRSWHRKLAIPASVAEAPILKTVPAGYSKRESTRPPVKRVEPSAVDSQPAGGGGLFAADTREVMEFGTAIHELFEQVPWNGDADVETVLKEWLGKTQYPERIAADACDQFREAMTLPEIRRELTRPEGRFELWRERTFDIIMDDRWVSGKFDRVVVHRDDKGAAVRVVVLDYKSKGTGGAGGYEKQMAVYREALSRMLGIKEAAVECKLVFTRSGKVVDVGKGSRQD
jgi:ATP-dependent helicase/nuclease subunit A